MIKTVFLAAFWLASILTVSACNSQNGQQHGSNASSDARYGSSETTGAHDEWSVVSLPGLNAQPVRLNLAYANNSRFKSLEPALLKAIMHETEQLVKQYFGLQVQLELAGEVSVQQLFATLNPTVMEARENELVDVRNMDPGKREALQESIYRTLDNYREDRQGVLDYAQPWLLNPGQNHDDFISLSYALADTLVSRLSYWYAQAADDGKPVIGDDPYHQWVWWDSLGYGDMEYDIVVTNQLVASAEYYGMDVHSSIRGGITAGTTSYSKHSSVSAYVYISVYPMINNSALLNRLRDDEHYDDEQVINYAAALLTHEIGHQLLHLGHPFARAECIMSPTTMLNYRNWYQHLDSDACKLGSSAQMTPGAARIEYNTTW